MPVYEYKIPPQMYSVDEEGSITTDGILTES